MRGLISLLKLMDIVHGEISGTDLEKKLLFDNLDTQEQDCVLVEEMLYYGSDDISDDQIHELILKISDIYSISEERITDAIGNGFDIVDHYGDILLESEENLQIIRKIDLNLPVTDEEMDRLKNDSWKEILLDVEGYEILQKLKI